MSAIVEMLRQIGRDLIDKRLWPVAVVLLAALVAVPVLVGGSNTGEGAPAAVAAADPGTAAAAPPPGGAATPAADKAATRSKSAKNGRIKDPFFDPPEPKAAGATSASPGAGGTRAEATSPTGAAAPRATGTPAPSKSTATANSTAPTVKPPAPSVKPRVTPAPRTTAPTSSYLRTVVRVNGAGGGEAHPISRLTPLGGTTDPAALFLGVAKAGARYAVFVLGPRATSRGQATCKGETDCRMFGLKAGQTQVVTVRPERGAIRRFTLRVESIKTVRASAARARSARARVHADGSRVRRAMRRHAPSAAALRTARYDRGAGVLRAVEGDVVKNASE